MLRCLLVLLILSAAVPAQAAPAVIPERPPFMLLIDEIDRLQKLRTWDAAQDQWIADRQMILIRRIVGDKLTF